MVSCVSYRDVIQASTVYETYGAGQNQLRLMGMSLVLQVFGHKLSEI